MGQEKMPVTLDRASHTYHIDGVKADSVTYILWENRLYDKTFFNEEARNRGLFVHEAIVLIDEGALDWSSVPSLWEGYLRSWEVFKTRHRARVVRSEFIVHDPLYGIAGMVDREMYLDDDSFMWSIDAKTSGEGKGLPPFWARYQTAAYEPMSRREFGGKQRRRGAVVLRADGGLPRITPYDDDGDWPAFLAMADATKTRRLHNRERKDE